jgi:hypothetical protein
VTSSAPSAEVSPAARAIASENAKAEAQAAAARSLLPSWVATAAAAPMLGEQARKERQAARVKAATLTSIDNLLDTVASEPATAAGLVEGARVVEEGKALGSDREWAGSGTSPGATLLHHGGMALLLVLGQRACAAKPGDTAVGAAADTAPLPPLFGPGGLDKTAAERDRHLLQEATRACGSHP